MSDRYTSVHAPGVMGSGFASLGRLSRAEAIQAWRLYHEQE